MMSTRRRLISISVKTLGRPRYASHSAVGESAFQAIKVKCGGAGDTTIFVHNPPKTSPLPLLLYIVPTLEASPLATPSIHPSFLSNAHATVLISLSFSPATPFPQPLHVLSFVYDAVREQHIKSRDYFSLPKACKLPPISVYGKGLGGTLAVALALSEHQPLREAGTYVDAVMARDAIYDHSPLANEYLLKYAKSKKQELEGFSMHDYLSPDSDMAYKSPPSNDYMSGPSISTTSPSPSPIIRTRDDLIKTLPNLFTRPEITFDPFISPILFFRGRSREIPTGWTWDGAPGKALWQNPNLEENERSRSYVTFPPKDSGLAIPWTKLCVTGDEEAPKKEVQRRRRGKGKEQTAQVERVDGETQLQELYATQAELMAKGMRRAIEKGHEDPRMLTAMGIRDVDAGERVQVVRSGSVDEIERDEIDGIEMNEWLRDIRG